MSEGLFVRGIVSLILSFLMFLLVENRYEEETELKDKESKRQKYLPSLSSGILIGVILGKTIYELLFYGPETAKHVTISICFDMFLHVSLYYILLVAAVSFLRKRMSARTCAAMWVLPNYLYHLFYIAAALDEPIWIVKIPKNYVEIIFYVWLLGFLFVFFRGIVLHLRFRSKILKNAKAVEDEEICELWNAELKRANMRYTKYPLMISENVKTPLSVGMLRSAICVVLPDRKYSPEELKLIFRHEIVHLGREDAGTKFEMLFFTAVCWFNPLMWIAMRKRADDLELSCDETVLLGEDEQTRRAYANLILNTAGDERGFTTCLSASAEALKYRLKNILKPNVRNSGAFTLAVVLFVLCMSCGHIALAYGEYTGKEIVYPQDETMLCEIDSMYLAEAEQINLVNVEEIDTEELQEYIDNLRVQNMTGNYSFDNGEKMVKLVYETAAGMRFVELRDHVLRIIALDEDDRTWRDYYLPEGVDWAYLEGMTFRTPISD